MPPEDETRLLLRCRAGDEAAVDLLMKAYNAVVGAMARRWIRAGIRRNDLVQEGHLGLLEALRRYDPDLHRSTFSAYATTWIEAQMKQHLADFHGPVRPTDDASRIAFFRDPAAWSPCDFRVPEGLPCGQPSPEEAATASLMAEARSDIVERCLALLSERERDIVRRRSLVEDPEPLEAIARLQGIRRQTVHGLEKRAMEKLQRMMTGMFGIEKEFVCP